MIIEQLIPQAEGNSEIIAWINTTLTGALRNGASIDLGECEHIVDFFRSKEAPKNFKDMKVGSARKASQQWLNALSNQAAGVVETEEDIEVIKTWEGGEFRLVKLVGKSAFIREGKLMGHCSASYHGKDGSENYSLRDSRNMPHTTIEVVRDGDYIQQIKGKGNGSVHPKYIKYVIESLELLGHEVRSTELSNLGYIKFSSKTMQLLDDSDVSFKELTFGNERYVYKYHGLSGD